MRRAYRSETAVVAARSRNAPASAAGFKHIIVSSSFDRNKAVLIIGRAAVPNLVDRATFKPIGGGYEFVEVEVFALRNLVWVSTVQQLPREVRYRRVTIEGSDYTGDRVGKDEEDDASDFIDTEWRTRWVVYTLDNLELACDVREPCDLLPVTRHAEVVADANQCIAAFTSVQLDFTGTPTFALHLQHQTHSSTQGFSTGSMLARSRANPMHPPRTSTEHSGRPELRKPRKRKAKEADSEGGAEAAAAKKPKSETTA